MSSNQTDDDFNMTGGLLGTNYINEFLVFMEKDSRGAINIEKSRFHIAIRAFLNKKPYALDYYKEFIKTSSGYFPKYEAFIEMINATLEISNYYIEQSPQFCLRLWASIHH